MAKKVKKSKAARRRRRRRVFFGLEITLLLVLICGVYVLRKAQDVLSNINFEESNYTAADISADEAAIREQKKQGYEIIALLGIDARSAEELKRNNSDTMILACIDHNNQQIKLASIYRDTLLNVGDGEGGDYYMKCNDAYNQGGAEQFLRMVNQNLDLNVTKYATVNFKGLAEAVDLLGGLDITMRGDEIIHMNNYCVETSEVTGMDYEPVEELESDLDMATVHVNGVQAVSYSRIRYDEGSDFRRASRQRLVLEKLFEKAKSAGIPTMINVMEQVLPDVLTNMTSEEIMSLGMSVITYSLGEQIGFPIDHIEDNVYVSGATRDVVVPVTLEDNVVKLHQFLFPEMPYTPSESVQQFSNDIAEFSGYGAEDIPEFSNNGTIIVEQETLY